MDLPTNPPLKNRRQVRTNASSIVSVLLAGGSVVALAITAVMVIFLLGLALGAPYGSEALANTVGIAAAVLGVLALLLPLAAVVIAARALREIAHSGGTQRGRGLAWVAIVTSAALYLLFLVVRLLSFLPA